MTGTLQGLKVADFTWVIAGPWVTKYFADCGATVVKVESARSPDTMRMTPPFKDNVPGLNRSGYFAAFNDGKLSLTLNLKRPRAREVARRLISWCDVMVLNFAPGTMEEWGLGYDNIRKINPGIVMLSTTLQGETGPARSERGFGSQLVGLAGFTGLTGWPDRNPVNLYGAYTDTIAPRFAAAAILAAVDHRRRTGEGQFIDLSQLEASLYFLGPCFLEYETTGRVARRTGNRSADESPCGSFPCAGHERWLALSVSGNEQWQALSGAMGAPAWSREGRFSTHKLRKQNEDEMEKLLAACTVGYGAEDLMARLQQAGVPAGVVQNARDVAADPQLTSRGVLPRLAHKEIGEHTVYAPGFSFSETPRTLDRAAPLLGEHTEYVCTRLLGMADAEFVSLLGDGVFE